ncbi:ABC transporter permease [Marinobacter sp. ANT_B65]|uniref:ABC transporter permease n=1 Tax=Marinobacter sp. ANT_B65 TaxID=2039467 RepID=UPI000BBF0899|nr:ABC transporter permease [Marinobacter sp. ANT_B65]PCM45399.1 ABC transporter permease [Marinobacter sp. ANT_B65]
MAFQFALQRRVNTSFLRSSLTFSGGLLLGLLLCVALLIQAGVPADMLFDDLVWQVFFQADGLAQTLTLSIPLILAGLSAALALRVRFWNIGIEGQLWLGAIAAMAVSIYGVGSDSYRWALMLVAAMAGGALWIAVPLWLKERFHASELVVTLLLSNVAFQLMLHLLFGAWRDPAQSFPISPAISEPERLLKLGFGNLHTGLFASIGMVFLIMWIMERSRFGFQSRILGSNRQVAEASGIAVGTTLVVMVLLSGAMAGLAGGLLVAGTEYRLTQHLGWNMTFSGIVIAFIARLRPFWVLPVAVVLAGVYNAGASLKVFYGLTEATVLLMQGIVLLSLLWCQFIAAFSIDRRQEVSV